MENAIILFSKVPYPGTTKTRLIPTLGEKEAANLQRVFIKDIINTIVDTGIDFYVAHTPECDESTLNKVFGNKSKGFFPQTGSGLGEKMKNAFSFCFEKGYKRVILIGSDCPEITTDTFINAFNDLKENDVVINPSSDGGYSLIGMNLLYEKAFNLEKYSSKDVMENTLKELDNLSVKIGESLEDIDTEDELILLKERLNCKAGCEHTKKYLNNNVDFLIKALKADECIGCNLCKMHCDFLTKYDVNTYERLDREELSFSCFLCGKCTKLCPKHIDGRELSILQRQKSVAKTGKIPKGYGPILTEKSPYKFSNYKNVKSRSVFFPGCNFSAYYPDTTKYLMQLMQKNNISTVFDCCSKPVYELGLKEKSNEYTAELEKKLINRGVREIITACPNCYHFLKDRMELKIAPIYEKLQELNIGCSISENEIEIFLPCPDRYNKQIFDKLSFYLKDKKIKFNEKIQCCGLGGCAYVKEPGLSENFVKNNNNGQKIFSYCASCIGKFHKSGYENAYHFLPLILGVDEKPKTGLKAFINKAKFKYYKL